MVRIDSNFSFGSIYELKKNSQEQQAQQTQNPGFSFKGALKEDLFEKNDAQVTNGHQAISEKLKALAAPVTEKANQVSQKAVAFAGNVKENVKDKVDLASSYVVPIFDTTRPRPWKVNDLNKKSVEEIDGIFKEAVAK